MTLHFADESTATADVVIGADGIRSVVRANMLSDEEHIEPKWSGVTAYRALVTREALEANGLGDHPMQAEPQMVGASTPLVLGVHGSKANSSGCDSTVAKAGIS